MLNPTWISARLTDLLLAFALLTRLPLPRLNLTSPVAVGNYVWAFPLVGLVIGCISGGSLWLTRTLGASPSIAALTALVASLLVTGALHEDGLADFWDGIGGGRTRERKLEIMRDSTIGAYGAAALFAGLALRWTALSQIANPFTAACALVVAHTVSRGLLVLVLEYWRPARKDGLAALPGGSWPSSIAALAISAAMTFAAAPAPLALAALFAAAAAVAAVGAIAGRYLGGYTGDVLGAAEQSAEALVLTVLATLAAR